jgi:basic membrane protein A
MLAEYRKLGGLRGIVSRRAETLYQQLGPDEQRATMQVFLRLVRTGPGTIDSRRRIPLQDLTDIDLDPVVLSTVLTAFAGYRLLSFDRDPVSGVAVVEVAHEALLREWDRLTGWIDRYRAAIRRHDVLIAAVEEWELSGRDADYLLTGSRLTEFEAWSENAPLALTARERAFLEAGLARRRAEEEREAARLEAHRRLERNAKIRLVGLAVAIAVALGALGYAAWTADPGPLRVALMGGGSSEAGAQIEAGFDRAASAFGMVATKRDYEEEHGSRELRDLSERGNGLIVVTSALDNGWQAVIEDHPETRYVLPFPYDAANVSYILSADQEAAYLAGAAAARKTKTGVLGFIGGLDAWFIWPFQAGFEAGARAVDPDVVVLSTYLATDEDFVGAFENPIGGRVAAEDLFDKGADVVLHAAGRSGIGLLEAARDRSGAGRHLWAVGVDTDQYETVAAIPGVVDSDSLRRHILTSVLKRQDLGVYTVLEAYARGELRPGMYQLTLANGGLDLSRSGGFIRDIHEETGELKAQIIAGTVKVPCVPEDRRAVALEQAAYLGLTLDSTGCRH